VAVPTKLRVAFPRRCNITSTEQTGEIRTSAPDTRRSRGRMTMSKKLSRRDFARTSLTAGAAAIALPAGVVKAGALASSIGEAPSRARSIGAAAARRIRAALPSPEYGYGGDPVAAARDSIALA